jgi:hypothetical protein
MVFRPVIAWSPATREATVLKLVLRSVLSSVAISPILVHGCAWRAIAAQYLAEEIGELYLLIDDIMFCLNVLHGNTFGKGSDAVLVFGLPPVVRSVGCKRWPSDFTDGVSAECDSCRWAGQDYGIFRALKTTQH